MHTRHFLFLSGFVFLFCIVTIGYTKHHEFPLSVPAHQTHYYKDGSLIPEQTEAAWWLSLMYDHALTWPMRVLSRSYLAAGCIGTFCDSKLSAGYIEPFIKRHAIDMGQFIVPEGGYQSFNQFFYRELQPNMRFIDSADNAVVSPADGKLQVMQPLSTHADFFLKRLPCNPCTLLGDANLAAMYEGGVMFMVRLAPYDYHRFHFPFACTVGVPRTIAGRYESVNPAVFKRGVQPLTCNTRTLIPLHTDAFGQVMMIAVGAMFVGSVITTYAPGIAYNAGDEAGYFAFGGSTVLLLFKKEHIKPLQGFIDNSDNGYETAVLMGQKIADL